jgi:hypothetical protein
VLYWLTKLRERKYQEHLALLREAEQKQLEIRDRYAAHNKKWTNYILQRKIALGLAFPEDIRDSSHTPITKSANDETTRYPSHEHESKENPEKTE